MHTYLKHTNGVYTVGLWLRNREGYDSFNPMFDVADHDTAMLAVNMLNGGDTLMTLKIIKHHG
jgi:hypothetical protein